jgi:hypothetical protein
LVPVESRLGAVPQRRHSNNPVHRRRPDHPRLPSLSPSQLLRSDVGQPGHLGVKTGVILDLDRKAAGLENLVGNFGIDAARMTAWVNAVALWRLRSDAWLSREYANGLDVAAALTGRSLMVPLL